MMKIARLLIPLALFASLTAMQRQPWGPNGNGTLDHEDDLRWVSFHDTQVVADQAKGEYRATFGTTLGKMDGHDLSITGYMLPVETSTTSPHFILTRRSAGCPFCPPNEPTEAIEIWSVRPIAYTQGPVTVDGVLHLVNRSGQGLFFRIDHAQVSE